MVFNQGNVVYLEYTVLYMKYTESTTLNILGFYFTEGGIAHFPLPEI